MKLARPLAFFDLETTGTKPESDRIVEIAIVRLHPDGKRDTWRTLVNPTVPIPESASAIHGIGAEDVAQSPTFANIAFMVEGMLEGCDLAGFNILRFDLPMLEAEFKRAGQPFTAEGRHLVDAMKLFHKFEPRDLSGAAQFYLGRPLVDAHGALPDVSATVDVLLAQVERYELPADAESLAKLCVDPDAVDRDGKFKRVDGEIVFTFGKYNGRKLDEIAWVDPNYVGWVLRGDFSESTKKVAHAALSKKVKNDEAAMLAAAARVGES